MQFQIFVRSLSRDRAHAREVSNALAVAWILGRYPEHFWLVYLVESAVLFPLRWLDMSQVLARPDFTCD